MGTWASFLDMILNKVNVNYKQLIIIIKMLNQIIEHYSPND